MWEELFELEDPVVLQGWDGPVFFRVYTVEEAFSSMNDEFIAASILIHHLDEVDQLVPFVVIIDAKATLDSHRNTHLRPHLCANLGH